MIHLSDILVLKLELFTNCSKKNPSTSVIEAVDEGGSLKGMQNFGFKEEKMESKFKFYQFGSKLLLRLLFHFQFQFLKINCHFDIVLAKRFCLIK